jgi:hypothetical protein
LNLDSDNLIKKHLVESNPGASRSWIAPDDTVYPLDVANGQFHVHWAEDNGDKIHPSLHVHDQNGKLWGERMMDKMILAGWIRKNNKELQCGEGHEHRVQAHIDRYGMGKWHQVKINLKAGGRKEMSFKEGEVPREW